ncbi:hypothetical protein [Helicobacter vulpis]|nr:hypothetical protein [Helicobacter vulpis]
MALGFATSRINKVLKSAVESESVRMAEISDARLREICQEYQQFLATAQ